MSQYRVFSIETSSNVATVWLDRPDKLNAMGHDFWDELPRIMADVSSDENIRAVVLASRARAFCVGLDLTEMMSGGFGGSGAQSGSRASMSKTTLGEIRRLQAAINSVSDCPKPTIAAINGYCLGGGIDLITACDIRYASSDAIFSVRETKVAIVADIGTLQRLPGVVGKGAARELVFTGRDVDAGEALAMGLVNHVSDDRDSLVTKAMDTASQIAANSPLAVQGSKQVMNFSEGRSVAEGLEYVAAWNSSYLFSNDLIEAMAAFAEKRPPDFTGS